MDERSPFASPCELPASCRTAPLTFAAVLDAMRQGEFYAKRFTNPSGNGPPVTSGEWDVSLASKAAAEDVHQWLIRIPGFTEFETVLVAEHGQATADGAYQMAAQYAMAHEWALHAVLGLPADEILYAMARRAKRELSLAAPSSPADPTAPAETTGKPTKRPSTRGRKKLPQDEENRRRSILNAWTQARNAGTSMKQFCREYNDRSLTVRELDKIVSWKAARDRRKGKS